MMEAMGRVHLEPDVILPSQLAPHPFATPERRLLLAVLEEAVGTFQRYAFAPDRQSRVAFADAQAWFASEETVRLCSFIGICEVLGIEATYLRAGLQRWLGTHRTRSREAAQPIYRFPFRRVNGTRHRTNARPLGMRRRA